MPKQPSYTVLPTHGPGWFRAGLSLCRLTLFRALISRNPNTRAPTTEAAIELSAERIPYIARPPSPLSSGKYPSFLPSVRIWGLFAALQRQSQLRQHSPSTL